MRTVNLSGIGGIDNLPDVVLAFVSGISTDGNAVDVGDAHYGQFIGLLSGIGIIEIDGDLRHVATGPAQVTPVGPTREVAEAVTQEYDDDADDDADDDDYDDSITAINSPDSYTHDTRELATKQPVVDSNVEIGRTIGGQVSSDARLVSDSISEVDALTVKLINATRKRNKLMEVVTSDSMIRKISDSMEAAKEVEHVIAVEVVDSHILIKTDELIANADGMRKIGMMGIYINLAALSRSVSDDAKVVRIINFSRRYGSYQCGHVNGNSICLGKDTNGVSSEVELATAVADIDIAGIARFMIKWIMNPNINDSWGIKATKFPLHEGGDNA